MPGLDYKKEYRSLYTGKAGRIDEIDVPRCTYLAVDGVGDPSTAIGEAMGGVYSIAYPLKFMIKARNPALDYVVMPPEALYPGPRKMYEGPRSKWRWTILVMQPVKPLASELTAAKARAKEKGAPASSQKVELRTIEEGHCVQTLHLGPYDKEHETVAKLNAYMAEHHLVHAAPHHEVYLSDPFRVKPEKIKTLIRQPVHSRKIAPMAAR